MVSRGQMLLYEAKLRLAERGFGGQQHCSGELNAPIRLQLLSEAPRNEYAQICRMTAGFAQKVKTCLVDMLTKHVPQARPNVFCKANRIHKAKRVPQDQTCSARPDVFRKANRVFAKPNTSSQGQTCSARLDVFRKAKLANRFLRKLVRT